MELIGKNITYKYPSSKKYVLKDVDITLNSDKITGLIGESGKGKSTLCKILSNYIPKYDGEVYLDNQILPKNGFCPVQLIFQHPEKVMNPKWKMKDILEESWNVSDDLISEFGIQQSWMSRYPRTTASIRVTMWLLICLKTQLLIRQNILPKIRQSLKNIWQVNLRK